MTFTMKTLKLYYQATWVITIFGSWKSLNFENDNSRKLKATKLNSRGESVSNNIEVTRQLKFYVKNAIFYMSINFINV